MKKKNERNKGKVDIFFIFLLKHVMKSSTNKSDESKYFLNGRIMKIKREIIFFIV